MTRAEKRPEFLASTEFFFRINPSAGVIDDTNKKYIYFVLKFWCLCKRNGNKDMCWQDMETDI